LPYFPYHRLGSDTHFQGLVWDVCRHLLGEGIEAFATGPDGGRDGRFSGTANSFPSKAEPFSGNFIIQDKWTQSESSTFAETSFQRQLLKEEVPKAVILANNGELDHWIIFSNRRKAADSSTELRNKLMKGVGCQSVHLRGAEELDGFLQDLPEIVKKHDLEGLLIPFRVEPQELRELIAAVYENRGEAMQRTTSRWDFADYLGIDRKNEVNVVSSGYFQGSIRSKSEPHFAAIKTFLENPRNWELAERYHEAASEIQAKAMAFRNRFSNFDHVFEQLCEEIWSMSPMIQQPGKKRILRVLLHYMYANCDLGQKP
jgi:hypothetical protein